MEIFFTNQDILGNLNSRTFMKGEKRGILPIYNELTYFTITKYIVDQHLHCSLLIG